MEYIFSMLRDFATVRAVFLDSLSWAGLVKYFAAILLLKFVHETAHSLAAIHFNCRERGIGLGFTVFYPRLYTDTTDSDSGENRIGPHGAARAAVPPGGVGRSEYDIRHICAETAVAVEAGVPAERDAGRRGGFGEAHGVRLCAGSRHRQTQTGGRSNRLPARFA